MKSLNIRYEKYCQISPRFTEMGLNILEAQFAEVVSTIETIRQAESVLTPEELT